MGNNECRIYTRKRIKCLNRKGLKEKIKNKRIIYIIFLFFSILISYNIIEKSVNSIFRDICENEANSIATKITNEESTKAMKNYKYEDMFTIEKNELGKIQMISANMITIDEITSNISSYIEQAIENSENKKIKIPIGSFIGMKILSASGPIIPIKIRSGGKINTELKSEFLSKGINQTIHRIYLQIDCEVSILTPFETIKENVSNQVLFAENIIIGEIPESYYNFEGIKDGKDTMETIK